MDAQRYLAQKRVTSYIVLAAVLLGGYFFLSGATWKGGDRFHTTLETIASFLALTVGIVSLVRFYSKKNNTFLFIGTAFLGTGLLDAYHAVVTAPFFLATFPTIPPSLIRWSWIASRIFLSALLFLSWWAWRKEEKEGERGQFSERKVYFFVTALTIASFLFFVFAPLPIEYYPDSFIPRPQELFPAFFFVLALVGYLKKGHWKKYHFEHWLILSLTTSFIGQTFFMPFAGYGFDALTAGGHIVKLLSYVFVFVGLLISTFYLFKTAEESKREIEEREAKDEALLAGIGEGVIATDRTMRIIFANNAAREILGWGEERVVGKRFFDMVSIADEKQGTVPEEQRPISRSLSSGEKVTTSAYYYLRRDKTRIPVLITSSPVNLLGVTIGVIVVFRDISREKEIDRAKTEFVSLASHELRAPLSAIRWYVEMLLSGDAGKLTKEQNQYLTEIYDSNQRMVTLVNALLSVSKIDLGTFAIEPEPTDITKIPDIAMKDLTAKIQEKKLKVVKRYEKNLPVINADPRLVLVVFQNFFSNALKYTPPGGTITVEIKKSMADILIKFSDTGYGIPKEEQRNIFTKLFRAGNIKKVEAQGTGLGLYIVKAIAEHSGGKIWFESPSSVKVPGVSKKYPGTTFYFTIPLLGMKAQKGAAGLK